MRSVIRSSGAVLVVLALGMAAQARALAPSTSGSSTAGTGIPESAEPSVDNPLNRPEVRSLSVTGVPDWYAVVNVTQPRPVHQPRLETADVPGWLK